MKKSNIPMAVRRAAARFHKDRAQYYLYLASMLDASKGNTKLSQMFENDARRYDKKPRGTLSAYWAATYSNNGADLAETWQGTLPDDEVTIVRVAKNAGDGALASAFQDIGRIAKLSDRVRSESLKTLMAGIFGLAIACAMAFVFPIFASNQLLKLFSFVPFEEWGPKGRAMVNHAQNVKDYWLIVAAPIAVLIYYVKWSINNLTGPIRDWLDEHVAIYRTIRDIKGTLFLATMSTLTRKRANMMFTLDVSLNTLAQSSRSPWFKWRIYEVLTGIEKTGATGSEAFQTHLISDEMYYFLRDIQEARGFSEGFEEVGAHIEEAILDKIVKSMEVYRWMMLISGVIVVAGVAGWNTAVIYEINGIVKNLSTR